MPRPERIARPARTDEWEIVAADKGVADGWTRWAAREPNALAAAQLSRHPTEFSPRQKKLEGKTWGTGTCEGRTYDRWQYEVTSGGRIFGWVGTGRGRPPLDSLEGLEVDVGGHGGHGGADEAQVGVFPVVGG